MKVRHFDLAGMEKAFREGVARQHAEGDAAVRAGIADEQFIHAQRCFDEARVQFALAGAKAVNTTNSDGKVAAAAGAALGMMLGSLLSSLPQELWPEVLLWEERAMRSLMSPVPTEAPEDASSVHRIGVAPMRGGHA